MGSTEIIAMLSMLAVAWCVIDYNIKCACHTKLKQERK